MHMQSIKPILESWKSGLINKTEDNELCTLYKKYGSDKKLDGDNSHNYPNLYYPIFQPLRNQAFNFFELGLGSQDKSITWNFNNGGDWKMGASLYAAEEFFPSASIYGADIDRTICLNPGRIKTFYCNAKDANSVQEMWNSPELKDKKVISYNTGADALTLHEVTDKKFEIILDDACHEFDANYCFAVNSLPKLAPQGLFIIEDVWEVKKWEEKRASLINDFNLDVFEILPDRMKTINLILMQVK